MNTSVDINKIYELIDLYKYASVVGERVEFIVTPFEENGKWDDSKRLITIGLQGGMSRDRDTFVVENAKEFDEVVLPQILSYFSHDDEIGKWNVVIPEVPDATVTAKGFAETESGNVFYLESLNEDIFDEVSRKSSIVTENTTYKKEKLTDEEKIWDELILYAKRCRIADDFYNSTDYTFEEKDAIYNFIVNLSNVKAISISNSRVYREKNEALIEELFKDKNKVLEYGLTPSLYEKIVNNSDLKKLARLVGAEKRLRRKVDVTNPEINAKLDFVLSELKTVDYFDLRNAGAVQFEDGIFKSSQPAAIMKLKRNIEDSELSAEEKESKIRYCDEIYGYLEKKTKNNSFT